MIKKIILLIFIFQIFLSCNSYTQNSLLWLRGDKKQGSISVYDFFSYKYKGKLNFPKYRLKIEQNEIVYYKKNIIFNKDSFINVKNIGLFFELFNDSILFITPKEINDYTPAHVKRKYCMLINLRNSADYYIVILDGKIIYPWNDIKRYDKTIEKIKNTYAVKEVSFKEKNIFLIKLDKQKNIIKIPLERIENYSYK